MQQFSQDSIDMGKIACFYLQDITGYLRANAGENDSSVVRTSDGDVEQALMFIGGWSKTNYLTELNIFYPSLNKLTRWGSSVKLMGPDMVTKRPILYQDNLFVLGRHHIHVVDLNTIAAGCSSSPISIQVVI